ncbi:MAG: zinc-binding dehydrogenase [Chloroflexi bacterium]|nr:zinc-binding dehydrogenase [Chloroflexota bacterium]
MAEVTTVRVHQLGGPEAYSVEYDSWQAPGPGEVSVRVHASGINPADLLYVQGRYFNQPELPIVPGTEAAGEVDAVGPGCTRFQVGQRVTLLPTSNNVQGTWRTQVLAPEHGLIATPAALSDAQAGAAWLVYLTAWVGLMELGGLTDGTTALLTAANSAVALAALDVCQEQGALAFGTVRSEAAASALRTLPLLGLLRTDEEGFADRLRSQVGEVDVVLDCLLGEVGEASLRVLRPYGTFVIYGALSGKPLSLRGGLAIGRQPTIKGLWIGRWLQDGPPERIRAAITAVGERLANGAFQPRVDRTFPLTDIQAAVTYSASAARAGKVVLTC